MKRQDPEEILQRGAVAGRSAWRPFRRRVEIKEWLQRNPSTAEKSRWIAYYE